MSTWMKARCEDTVFALGVWETSTGEECGGKTGETADEHTVVDVDWSAETSSSRAMAVSSRCWQRCRLWKRNGFLFRMAVVHGVAMGDEVQNVLNLVSIDFERLISVARSEEEMAG